MKHSWSIPVVLALWLIAEGVALTQAPSASTQNAGAGRAQTRVTKNPLEGNREAIRNGGAMFRTRCAGCHGPDARGDRGPDLTGLWASGVSDDRIFETVRQGVPGSEMPGADPLRVPDREIWQVLAYVRTLAGSTPPQAFTGTPENGERIFQKTCRTGATATGCEVVHGVRMLLVSKVRPEVALKTSLLASQHGDMGVVGPHH